MSLIVRIEEFFIQYDKAEEKPEYYLSLLLQILHILVGDRNNEERLKINSICASLESDRDDIKILVNEREGDDVESLKRIRKNVRTTINDFRHGEILKKYIQNYSERPGEGRTTPPSPSSKPKEEGAKPNIAEDLSIISPERAVDLESDPMLVAISIARKRFPDAKDEEILRRAAAYVKAAASRGAKEEAATTRGEVRH